MNPFRDPLISGAILLAGFLAPFVALEAWARTGLFEHALYSNSDAVDRALDDFAARPAADWDILILGDSEARWGFDPQEIEEALSAVDPDIAAMNFAMDGFSTGWNPQIAERMRLRARMPELKVVIFGVQLIEGHTFVTDDRVCEAREEGGLRAAIFDSAFARDWKLTEGCSPANSPARILTELAEDASAVARNRREIRSLILGRPADSVPLIGPAVVALPESYHGYQPHIAAADNATYEEDLERARQEIAGGSGGGPLPPDLWREIVSDGEYFDAISGPYREAGVLPVFVALPTNPLLIDLKDRRADYRAHSDLLAGYAERTGAVFIDLGIQDELDPQADYSDHRHLSFSGAEKFSMELGRALAANERVRDALTSRRD